MKATDLLRERAVAMQRKAARLMCLANQVDAMERHAARQGDDVPCIGVGSAAEQALFELAESVRV